MKRRTICSVEACDGKVLAKEYCCRHYYQVKRHGCVREDRKPSSPFCTEAGCGFRSYARGLCSRHYQKSWRRGRGGVSTSCRGGSGRSPSRRGSGGRAWVTARGCAVPGCFDRSFDAGFCRLHYIQMRYLRLLDPAAARAEAARPSPRVLRVLEKKRLATA